jgi:hypothetical protein
MNAAQQKRDAFFRRRAAREHRVATPDASAMAEQAIRELPEPAADPPRHDPWSPKQHPRFLGRMKRRKKQAIAYLGGKVAP